MNRVLHLKLKIRGAFFVTLLSIPFLLSAQKNNTVLNPNIKEFSRTLRCLSSDSMQGREAGTKGATMASEFIAPMMHANGLHPFGDKESASNTKRSWYQNFEALSYKADRDSMTLRIGAEGKALDYKPVEAEIMQVRNVLGIVWGSDTSRSIIIGAHYDHLGIRDGKIYNGSDDNASGVSGVLALAKSWSGSSEKPPCNIIFAAWTAEEKGLIGSQYFIQNLKNRPGNILFALNMDMISRSAPEDSTGRIISVGTLPQNENLREIVRDANKKLKKPFNLDLWDVKGHYGSDYAYFAEREIPLLTFFSGFDKEYHTPEDKFEKADLQKMRDILELVNECIWQVANKIVNGRLSGE